MESLLALAALAGQTLVAAATTDVWEWAKNRFAQVLGRGDPQLTQTAEGRLEDTKKRLEGLSGQELERTRTELELTWRTRLEDLLEEHPDTAGDLQLLVDEIRAALPAGVSASGHAIAAGRDVSITASKGGVAAQTIHGPVSTGNPPQPGPGKG